MKSVYLLIFPAILIGLTSCSDDEDPETTAIHGEWHLANISGGFPGINDDYDRGLVIWDFNSITQQVTIQNNIPTWSFVVNVGIASDTYDYQINEENNNEILIIDDNRIGVIVSLNSEQLVIDDGLAADGFQFTFEK